MRRGLVWLVAGVILVSGVLVAAAVAQLRTEALASAERLTASFAQVVAEQTARTFQTIDQRLLIAETTLLRLSAAAGIDEGRDREALRQEIKDLPFVRALSVADRNGRIVASSQPGTVGRSVADRAYFQTYQNKRESDFEIGMPVRGQVQGAWLISATRPLRSPDGIFAGLMIAAVEPSYFERLWVSANLDADGSIAMFRRDGLLMMRSPFDENAMGKPFPGLPVFSMTLDKNPSGVFHRSSAFDGIRRVFAYRVLPSRPDLLVVVGQSYGTVLAPWRRFATLALAVWTGVSVGLIVLLVFLNRTWLQRSRIEAEVDEMAQRLALATDAASIGVWDWDLKADRWYATPTYFALLGYDPDKGVRARKDWLDHLHPDDREAVAANIRAALEGEDVPYRHDARVLHADGSFRWMSVIGRVLSRDAAGKPSRLLGVMIDITEARHTEEALREGEERFAAAFEQAPIGVALVSPEGRFLRVNQALCDLLGYAEAELLARTFQDVTDSEDLEADLENVRKLLAGESRSYQMEKRYVHARGHLVHTLLDVSLVRDSRGGPRYFISQIQDITARKRSAAALESSLREKEGLLKEVHHRVKNNLQVIASLLRLETHRSGDSAARAVLEDMQGRIRSMALLHEMLYRTGKFARVDLADYLSRLATQLLRGQNSAPGRIHLALDLSPLLVEIDQAIPAALIVNELLSNSLKHGFPDGRVGELRLVLRTEPDGLARLEVSDTGAGLSAEFEARRGKSLGLQLVFDLARQLGGELKVGPPPAAVFTVTFRVSHASEPKSLPAAS